MGPDPIENEFVVRVGAIVGIKKAIDYDPHVLPPLPAVTMLFMVPDDRDHQTGPATQVTWRWRVRLIVPLTSKQGSDWKRAQEAFKTYLPKLLKVIRADPTIGGTCQRARLADLGEEPEFDVPMKAAFVDMLLTATTEEV